jgi:hypothetical protein
MIKFCLIFLIMTSSCFGTDSGDEASSNGPQNKITKVRQTDGTVRCLEYNRFNRPIRAWIENINGQFIQAMLSRHQRTDSSNIPQTSIK